MGTQHCLLGLHALWGLRAAGVVGGRPRGGWPATVTSGVWCQALSLPRPPVLWSGRLGLRDPCVPGAVGAGVGTLHRPHSVRPCELALLAVRVAEGRSQGGAFHHCEGRLWSGAPPLRTARPLGGLLASATHMLWSRVCGCWGPTLSPWPACRTAQNQNCWTGYIYQLTTVERVIARARATDWRDRPVELFNRVQPSSTGGLNSNMLFNWVQPLFNRYAQRCAKGVTRAVGAACRGGGGGPSPGGGVACHRCEGRLVSGAVPPPAARPLKRAARVPRPVCPGCGPCGRGD